MMNKIQKLLLTLAVMMAAMSASAYDFEVDGIYYKVISLEELTCEVSKGDLKYSGSVIIPTNVTYSERTFSVKSIGSEAFAWCDGLKSVEIPNSVLTIGSEAFTWCRCLIAVEFPNSVKSIGDCAFYGCSSLTSVDIPYSVNTIGDGAFSKCDALVSITGKFSSDDNRFLLIDGELNSFASAGLTSYVIPNTVTSIGKWAFAGCPLSSVIIPNTVTEIGNYAFAGSGMYSVVIPNSVIKIGDWAFSNCRFSSIEFGNSVKKIGRNAFYDCENLTTLVLGQSVTFIGDNAFEYCIGLTSVEIPNSVSTIGRAAFYQCHNLTTIDIPNSVTEIGEWAFTECYSLESITGKFASEDNRSLIVEGKLLSFAPFGLSSYEIPNNVNSIGTAVFYGYSILKSVVLPKNVTHIGDYAFYNCYDLKEITSLAVSPPIIYNGAFSGVSKEETIVKVPSISVEEYKRAYDWRSFRNIVGIDASGLEYIPDCKLNNTAKSFNLHGVEAGEDYKGIVIKNGKKVLKR